VSIEKVCSNTYSWENRAGQLTGKSYPELLGGMARKRRHLCLKRNYRSRLDGNFSNAAEITTTVFSIWKNRGAKRGRETSKKRDGGTKRSREEPLK